MPEISPAERLEIFKSQNQENGSFDVAFEIDGKHIYAHKTLLESVSPLLKTMIAIIERNNEKLIKIEKYSYDDFFDFLSYIYSGTYEFDEENVFTMLDLSEYYEVPALQQECDKYLSEMELSSENVVVEYFYEFSKSFSSLPLFAKALLSAIKEQRINLVRSKKAYEENDFGISNESIGNEEYLFKAIYEWAEHQALKKQDESYEDDVAEFDLNEAIKAEISHLLPCISFEQMNLTFLHRYVVKKGFLFAYDELSEMLDNVHTGCKVKVRVTNLRGQSICGSLPKNSEAIEIIKCLKDVPSADSQICWNTKCKISLTPSALNKRDGIEWYLVYFKTGGKIGVEHSSNIGEDSHYLLAEMAPEFAEFGITGTCKIEIV